MTLWERIWERYCKRFEQKELEQRHLNEALETYLGDGLDALAMQQIDDGGQADDFLRFLSERWEGQKAGTTSSKRLNVIQ